MPTSIAEVCGGFVAAAATYQIVTFALLGLTVVLSVVTRTMAKDRTKWPLLWKIYAGAAVIKVAGGEC